MQHWYVYHSIETMKHAYATTGLCAVYSTKIQRQLCFGDAIWVIEGDMSTPRQFSLVDCFRYEDTVYPPFGNGYDEFKLCFIGKSSLLKKVVPLSKSKSWFDELHGRYITKQRFFSLLTSEPQVVAGLQDTAGIAF